MNSAKIFTKVGDNGSTTFAGKHVPKSADCLELCGTIDEASSMLGLARSLGLDPWSNDVVQSMQHALWTLSAELACQGFRKGCGTSERSSPTLTHDDVLALEDAIDHAESDIKPLTSFVLPGGVQAAAALHVARAVVRRAERRLVALSSVETVRGEVLAYANRASDLLFVLARRTNHRAGIADELCGSARSGEAPT